MVAPLRTTITFASDSIHQVIAPNKVVELKENSIVVESPFEGSTEIPFFVRPTSIFQPIRVELMREYR